MFPRFLVLFPVLLLNCSNPARADESGLSDAQQSKLISELESTLKQYPKPAPDTVNATQIHSRRGDTLFFLGRFSEAVTEYEAMVTADPSLDASHWRLGIAYFFADQPIQAAAQFDKYHSFDQVDRENGIWRYLSHYKARGADEARKELLRYEKDDREPFPAVYRLFDGSMTPQQALDMIGDDLPSDERDKRLFYTELYIGMHQVVQGQPAKAMTHLRRATLRQWPRRAGFGPAYMWHVGRVQLNMLHDTPATQK